MLICISNSKPRSDSSRLLRKSSELKTVSLSRIARDNLVNNDDATIFNNDFNTYSVFDELHYLNKPWRNLETFESSLWLKQFVYFARKDREKSNYSMRIDSVVRNGSRFHSCTAIPNFAQKNSCNLDQNSKLLVQLHWSIQNSSCTLNVPMFLCNFCGRVVLKLVGLRSSFTVAGSNREPGLNSVRTRPWHTELCFRIKNWAFFS